MTPQLLPLFRTELGSAYLEDSSKLLSSLPGGEVQLIFSSPPFSPGPDSGPVDSSTESHADWLMGFINQFGRLLSPDGSVVLEFGTTRAKNLVERQVDCFEVISRACRAGGWRLRQDFYWYNPKFLVNLHQEDEGRPAGFRESVTICCWFSRSAGRTPDLRRVANFNSSLAMEYGNLLTFTDDADDENYLNACRTAGMAPHRDRFPSAFPRYFIELLTERGDLVLDPFAGSCTTGAVAERLGRRWICVEREQDLLRTAPLRFGPN